MELKDIQEGVRSLVEEKGWDDYPIGARLAYLHEEVEETEEEIALFDGTKESKERIGLELFDIIWNVAELANRFNIDLGASAKQKMETNSVREFTISPSVKKVLEIEDLIIT